MIDHILVPRKNRWFVTDSRVLHAKAFPAQRPGDGGAWDWGEYTDHEPVELTCREARDWRPSTKRGSAVKRPAWASLRGPTEEAKRRRAEFHRLTDQAIDNAGEEISWGELVAFSHEAGLEALGEAPRPARCPWLVGKEGDVATLDGEIATARDRDRAARSEPRTRRARSLHNHGAS